MVRYFQIGILIFIGLSGPANAGVTITDVKFTNVVTVNGQRLSPKPIDGSISRNKLGRLYARFTIIGTSDTIKALEQSGQLSVRAQWRINNQVNETLEIGITQDRWEQGESEFRRQVAEDGFFKFRTATFRDYIPIGTYKLTIRDIAGNPISPEAYPGPGIYQPTLEVTE